MRVQHDHPTTPSHLAYRRPSRHHGAQHRGRRAAGPRQRTASEYLAWERVQPERHEDLHGEVFRMAGGSLRHNALSAAVIRDLGVVTRGTQCRVLTSDQRIMTWAGEHYVYADASLVCGAVELAEGTTDVLANPKVIFAVLWSRSRSSSSSASVARAPGGTTKQRRPADASRSAPASSSTWTRSTRGPSRYQGTELAERGLHGRSPRLARPLTRAPAAPSRPRCPGAPRSRR